VVFISLHFVARARPTSERLLFSSQTMFNSQDALSAYQNA